MTMLPEYLRDAVEVTRIGGDRCPECGGLPLLFILIRPDGDGLRRLECRIACPDLHHADETMLTRSAPRPRPRTSDRTTAIMEYRLRCAASPASPCAPTRVWRDLLDGFPGPCPLCGLDADALRDGALACPRHAWMRADGGKRWDALVDALLPLRDPCPFCAHPVFPHTLPDGRLALSCDCATGSGDTPSAAAYDYRRMRSQALAARRERDRRLTANTPIVRDLRAWIGEQGGES